MVQGMPRRHFFDNGYPVTKFTLLAGSQVLLAVSRQSVRTSRFRLATALLRLADSSQRVIDTLYRSRDKSNYGHAARPADPQLAAGARRMHWS
jgi:hypothetical protein